MKSHDYDKRQYHAETEVMKTIGKKEKSKALKNKLTQKEHKSRITYQGK